MASIPALAEKLQSFDPDIVILETRQWRAKILERILHVPIATYYHAMPPRTRLMSRIDGLLARGVKLVMTNSLYMQAHIKELYGLDEVKTVYPGIDIKRYKPSGEQNGYILHISRIVPSKNHKFIIHVFKRSKVAKRMVIAGSCTDRRYLEQLKSISPPTVTFRPNISEDEKVRLLQRCSFFLYPPVDEPFGIAVLEAMACGKPVIASISSLALQETVGNEAGILCPPVLSEWVRAIEILSGDQKLVDQFGKRARKIAARFSWSSTVEKLEQNIVTSLKCWSSSRLGKVGH